MSVNGKLEPMEVLPIAKKEATQFTAVLSCAMYTFCSVSMVLVNKYISSNMAPEVKKKIPELTIVLFQCIVAVVLVEIARAFKIVEYPSFNLKTAKQWLPLNILFVGMLCSSFIALIYVNVPMFTVFKNLTNCVTVAGDWFLFDEP